jgi:aerobic carbon-monoxide dehydrogenase large subunit
MTVTDDAVDTNAVPTPDNNLNDLKPVGFGRMLRKEDPRFVRGMGQYCDDVQLPGMLHLAILRSPLAHARIVSIDKSAAEAHPKVVAVITGADLAEKNLAWMPTLSNDVQAVLATDKVRFQHQEVAFVVAEDRYSARDALELIDVEYDDLDPVIDVRKALEPDAPIIRDDLDGKTDNHCFDWETGDKDATEAVFADAEVVVSEDIVYPRVHPAPMETCGCVADYERVSGKTHTLEHHAGAARAPHCVRARLRAARAQDPHHRPRHRRRLRRQGADLPRVRVRDRGVARHRQAGEVDGGPHREPRQHRLRP